MYEVLKLCLQISKTNLLWCLHELRLHAISFHISNFGELLRPANSFLPKLTNLVLFADEEILEIILSSLSNCFCNEFVNVNNYYPYLLYYFQICSLHNNAYYCLHVVCIIINFTYANITEPFRGEKFYSEIMYCLCYMEEQKVDSLPFVCRVLDSFVVNLVLYSYFYLWN